MTPIQTSQGASGRRPAARRAAIAAACALPLLAAPGLAKGPRPASEPGAPTPAAAPAPLLQVGPDDQAIARRLEISAGRSLVVELPRDAKEVFVANPAVANAVVRSTRKLFVIGMANGATSIFVMDAEGRQIAALEVNVGRDLTVLRQTLRAVMPKAQIEVRSAGDSVLLTGTVDSAGDAQQAADLAKAFVGNTTSSGGVSGAPGASVSQTSTGGVINSITIRGRDQVMVRVTVVEISRSILKQLGVKTSGEWSALKLGTEAVFPISQQNFASNNTLRSISTRAGSGALDATLQAFERAGVSRVLAEPTLTAISGESATFTAGGEIPVPQGQSFDNLTGRYSISVAYKPYGVNLAFTPVVLSEGRISLRVNTEVTELDYENAVTLSQINVPALRVRKAATTVELPSGGTMMTAGIINQQSNSAVTGVPGLINLPVLGALFRSRDYQRRETELMIMVTPYIAKPIEPAQAARPDDGYTEASDPQTVLFGRLNRLYGVAGAPTQGRRLRGRFGFITD